MSKNIQDKIKYIPREIEVEIEKLLDLPQIIALVGPRRSGKTTLLLHLKEKLLKKGKKVIYLSFEDQEVLTLFTTDIKNFARLYLGENQFLFLDEFHYAQNGGKQLKYLFDFYPGKKIIISGSSTIELTIRALKYLVGRALVVTLYPFSFSEFLLAKEEKLLSLWRENRPKQLVNSPLFAKFNTLLEEYLLFGGYPEVVLTEQPKIKKQLLSNIINILFLREVKDFLSFADTFKLQKLIRALSLQIGNLINLNELGQLSSLDFRTLKRYLAFLEKVFVIRLVPPFFTNKRKELVKTPKVYFIDPGLRNTIIDNFAPLSQRVDAGSLLENGVFAFLRQNEVKFWHSKGGAEVDFILEKEGKIIPLEVKTKLLYPKISRSFSSFLASYQPKRGFLVSLSPQWKKIVIKKAKITFIPLVFLSKIFP